MVENSNWKKGTHYLFRPTDGQIIEITELITESNTSPLLNGDNDLAIRVRVNCRKICDSTRVCC